MGYESRKESGTRDKIWDDQHTGHEKGRGWAKGWHLGTRQRDKGDLSEFSAQLSKREKDGAIFRPESYLSREPDVGVVRERGP